MRLIMGKVYSFIFLNEFVILMTFREFPRPCWYWCRWCQHPCCLWLPHCLFTVVGVSFWLPYCADVPTAAGVPVVADSSNYTGVYPETGVLSVVFICWCWHFLVFFCSWIPPQKGTNKKFHIFKN